MKQNETTTKPAVKKQAVYRHVLTALGHNVLMLDPQARLTHAQRHHKGVEVFFLVDPTVTEDDMALRTFYVAATGETVEGNFLATVALPGMKAHHIFEA